MPQIIVTSRYLKPGSKKQLSNYMKYIATREGAVTVQSNSQNAPVTPKQQALILSLLTDFPESRESQTFQNYTAHPTQQNASALISEIAEHNADRIITKEKYVVYIATRPGAVKSGQHGLFSQTDAPIDLNTVSKKIANHTGNVWTHVVSLRRDDAQRMGYDNLTAWRDLVKRQMPNIAKQMKIDCAGTLPFTTRKPIRTFTLLCIRPIRRRAFSPNTALRRSAAALPTIFMQMSCTTSTHSRRICGISSRSCLQTGCRRWRRRSLAECLRTQNCSGLLCCYRSSSPMQKGKSSTAT